MVYTISMDTTQDLTPEEQQTAEERISQGENPQAVEEQLLARRKYDEERARERNEEKVWLEWTAPSRPYKKRDREFYTTVAIIVFLVSLILFFAGQFLFIAVVVSVAFVTYVLATVPPDHVHNALTTFGIHTGENLFYWEELGRFWFTTQYGSRMLHVETARAFPGVLVLLLENMSEDEVKRVMIKYTTFEKPKDTWLDNAAKWLQEKFPLEKE